MKCNLQCIFCGNYFTGMLNINDRCSECKVEYKWVFENATLKWKVVWEEPEII